MKLRKKENNVKLQFLVTKEEYEQLQLIGDIKGISPTRQAKLIVDSYLDNRFTPVFNCFDQVNRNMQKVIDNQISLVKTVIDNQHVMNGNLDKIMNAVTKGRN